MIALSDYASAITEMIFLTLDYFVKNTQDKKSLMFEQEQMLTYDLK